MKFPRAKAEVQIPEIAAWISSSDVLLASMAAFWAPENDATSNAAVPSPRRTNPPMVSPYEGGII